MFPNIVIGGNPSAEKSLKQIYQKFNNILSFVSEPNKGMQSADETIAAPAASGDLMSMSPHKRKICNTEDTVSDLLTGPDFDSICDVTMNEVPTSDDMFIDATSIDYLVKCASSNRNMNLLDRGKESLYVKFDPLYSRQKQEQQMQQQAHSVSSSCEFDTGYETSSAASTSNEHFVATPKRCMSTDSMAYNFLKEKPTQRVLPAVKQDLSETVPNIVRSTPALVRSVSAILTPSRVAIDRLINFAGSTPPVNAQPQHSTASVDQFSTHQLDHLQSLRNILQKQDQEVLSLRQDNRELRATLQDTEHKLTRTIEDMNAKVKKLTEERDALLEREDKWLKQISEKNMSNKQMSIVMEEYEKTISSLIGDQQKEKFQAQEHQEQLINERDDALKHLTNMEASFNDLLSKYEKCKHVILESKDREKTLMSKISEYEESVKKYDELYTSLKQVTSESLDKANETLDTIKKTHVSEIAKLNATIKKNELNMSSLQESLTQKIRENEELTRICDQLIAST